MNVMEPILNFAGYEQSFSEPKRYFKIQQSKDSSRFAGYIVAFTEEQIAMCTSALQVETN